MANDRNGYDAVIADLEADRDQLNNMIAALKRRKAGAPGASAAANRSSRSLPSVETIPDDAFFGISLPDAAHKYLSLVKKPTPHPEFCDALLAGGFKTTASNFREVVRSTLSRHPDFVRVRRGEWGLKEWYNRGPRRTKRNTVEVQSQPAAGEADGDQE